MMNKNETATNLPWVMSGFLSTMRWNTQVMVMLKQHNNERVGENSVHYRFRSRNNCHPERFQPTYTHNRHAVAHTNNNRLATLTKDWKLSPFFPRSSCPMVHWFRNQVKKDIKSRLGKKQKTSFLRRTQQTSMFYCLSPCSNWKKTVGSEKTAASHLSGWSEPTRMKGKC